MIRHWKPLWYLLVGLGLIMLLAACDIQVPESVPTRISEVRPERPTAEQPVPEAPAPEQPAPEQPTAEQPVPEAPAPEQPAPKQPVLPTATPAALLPLPTPPAQPDDNRLIDTLLILLVLAIIVVVYFLGRTIGRDRQQRNATEAAMAAPAPPPAPVQNTFNMAPPVAPPPVAPPAPIQPVPPVDAQRRFVYYPGTDTIPVPDTPPIYDRSHTITIDLLRNADEEEGVLLALGSMQAGYAVYVQNQRLIYTLALGSITKQIVANAAMPIGQVRVRFEFNRTGAFRGTGALFINEQLVGAQIFANTIPLPPGEGLDIGIDRGIPVTSDYPAPFPYTGVVQSVVYELIFDSAADQA